jgi:sulfur-oxidizing protein SoxX
MLVPATASAGAADVEAGKKLAFDRKKGNCLACHMIEGGQAPGNIAPPLIAIKGRISEDKLKAQIWDATQFNPDSPMPAFGKYKALSEAEIDKIIAFLMTL